MRRNCVGDVWPFSDVSWCGARCGARNAGVQTASLQCSSVTPVWELAGRATGPSAAGWADRLPCTVCRTHTISSEHLWTRPHKRLLRGESIFLTQLVSSRTDILSRSKFNVTCDQNSLYALPWQRKQYLLCLAYLVRNYYKMYVS